MASQEDFKSQRVMVDLNQDHDQDKDQYPATQDPYPQLVAASQPAPNRKYNLRSSVPSLPPAATYYGFNPPSPYVHIPENSSRSQRNELLSIDESVTIGRRSPTGDTSHRATDGLASPEYSHSTMIQDENVAPPQSLSLPSFTVGYAVTNGIRKASKIYLKSCEDDWIVVEGYKVATTFQCEGKEQILLKRIGNVHT
jgi:hypothetical protein